MSTQDRKSLVLILFPLEFLQPSREAGNGSMRAIPPCSTVGSHQNCSLGCKGSVRKQLEELLPTTTIPYRQLWVKYFRLKIIGVLFQLIMKYKSHLKSYLWCPGEHNLDITGIACVSLFWGPPSWCMRVWPEASLLNCPSYSFWHHCEAVLTLSPLY